MLRIQGPARQVRLRRDVEPADHSRSLGLGVASRIVRWFCPFGTFAEKLVLTTVQLVALVQLYSLS